MSKHISRAARWSRWGPNEHRSAVGRVYYRAGQWHAAVAYQPPPQEADPSPPAQHWELGKFRRARNAMMAVEDQARELERRYGPGLLFLDATGG